MYHIDQTMMNIEYWYMFQATTVYEMLVNKVKYIIIPYYVRSWEIYFSE